jgi:hypothetical protein
VATALKETLGAENASTSKEILPFIQVKCRKILLSNLLLVGLGLRCSLHPLAIVRPL